MKKEHEGYAKLCGVSSNVLLSLAVTAIAWLAGMVVILCLDEAGLYWVTGNGVMWLIWFMTFVVFCWMMVRRWNARVSAKLYRGELAIGGVLLLVGILCFIGGVSYSGGEMFGGLLLGLLGLYLVVVGLLVVVAGVLGWGAKKLS